jgi:single-strand DNA-binding protein
MPNLNRVFLMGNLTRDPEIRYTPSGMAVASFGLAVNRKWRDKSSGEMREEVTFVDIDAWGKQAELAGQYLAKGRPLFVEGRLRLDQWDDRATGQKRSRLKVVCDRFEFLGTREGGAGGAAKPAAGQKPAARPGGPAKAAGKAPAEASGETPEGAEGSEDSFEASEDIPF